VQRPFEADERALTSNLEDFVDATFADLQSSFLVLPMGNAFVEYPDFREAYEVLKRSIRGQYSEKGPHDPLKWVICPVRSHSP
jgi:hypothetical protein